MPLSFFHLRLATAGDITTGNVHFWEREGWYFAHNGTTSEGYAGYGKHAPKQPHSDSYLFFERLIAAQTLTATDIDIPAVLKQIKEWKLWGRFVLYHHATRKTYFFGDFHLYMMDDDIMYLASAPISFVRYATRYGYSVSTPDDSIARGAIDGVHLYDMTTQMFTKLNYTIPSIYEYDMTSYSAKRPLSLNSTTKQNDLWGDRDYYKHMGYGDE